MPLLGPDGEPIRREVLTTPRAVPTAAALPATAMAGGLRSPWSGPDPSAGLTPDRLGRILRAAEQGDPIAYLELAERLEEKDLHYAAVLGTRKRAVSQLQIQVEAATDDPADVRIAEALQAWVDQAGLASVIEDMLDAVGKGYSVCEIVWETTARQWRPSAIDWVDPRWLRLDPSDGRTLYLVTEAGTEALAPGKWIVHRHRTKAGLPVRGGLARPAAWGFLFKSYAVKDWVIFAEAYGHPLRVGKYHPGASQDEKDVLLQAVAAAGPDRAVIIPDGMLLEIVQGNARASADLYERLADWVDRQVSKLVLGQTLTTEVSGGSYAAAKVHGDVRDDLRDADALQVQQTLMRHLVGPWVSLNHGPSRRAPRLRLTMAESEDLKLLSEALTPFIDRGLRVEASAIRDRFGLAEPEADSEILTPATRSPATAPTAVPAASPPAAAEGPATVRGWLGRPDQPQAMQSLHIAGADDAAIDRLIGAAIAEGDAMGPMVGLLLDAASAATGYADFVGRVQQIAAAAEAEAGEDGGPLADVLARLGFSAAVAGRLGAGHGLGLVRPAKPTPDL